MSNAARVTAPSKVDELAVRVGSLREGRATPEWPPVGQCALEGLPVRLPPLGDELFEGRLHVAGVATLLGGDDNFGCKRGGRFGDWFADHILVPLAITEVRMDAGQSEDLDGSLDLSLMEQQQRRGVEPGEGSLTASR